MKRFEKDGKINFVDENNVFVGYDMEQSCCERADWYISKDREKECKSNDFDGDLTYYRFDKEFFEEEESGFDGDAGGMVRFRLLAEGKPDLFLHIFNSHNGYYGHGFNASINGIDWHSGCL